ncbi:MAG: hypothetical protein QG568_739 [Patescibacteria group bacterium]|nr:hypothetical protein [Patescibacteria group bacterium]
MKHEGVSAIAERKEQLKEGLGLVLCTRQKDSEDAFLGRQIDLAHELCLPAVQFDLRHRTNEDIEASLSDLRSFHEKNSECAISIHGEVPKIDQKTLDISNRERVKKEIELTQALDGESYTVHPPNVASGTFETVEEQQREKVLNNYARLFIPSIKSATEAGSNFAIALENMPTKGKDGAWGQTPEDIELLLSTVCNVASLETGIDMEEVQKHVGITFDVNHALHDMENIEQADQLLTEWFIRLGNRMKVIHIYMPSSETDSFLHKYEKTLELAAEYAPHSRLFLESKNNADSTKSLYISTKNL